MHNPINRNFSKSMVLGYGLVAALLLGGCGGRGQPAIKATPQSITFGAAPSLNLGGTATISASATSGLAVNYSTLTHTICSVNSSGLVTNIAVGSCVIAADQDGNATYAPAPQVIQNISVNFDPHQTISFGAAPSLTVYGTAYVAANSNSGLAVSYNSLTPNVCSVVSNKGLVSNLTIGDCTIAADQAGNTLYLAAPQVTQTLSVLAWTGAITPPSVPTQVSATIGNSADTVVVSFDGPTSSGGSPITNYTVTSVPSGISASRATSPITLSCTTPCTGYAFNVVATNSVGDSAPSTTSDVITKYNVVTTIFEPDTQPNDTIFTGSFTFNSTTQTVTQLNGVLSESMIGPPMPTVPLNYQLSNVSDGMGGLLVSAFALNTTNVYSEGGFAANSQGYYYGWPSAPNPAAGGVGNSFITINVPLGNPTNSLNAAQINTLAYGDCAAGGMMGDTCMTGHGGVGTMGGYPVSQTITKQ
jgi:hypothetical protein